MPWMFPEGEVCGVFRSPCASTQMMPVSGRLPDRRERLGPKELILGDTTQVIFGQPSQKVPCRGVSRCDRGVNENK